MCYSISLQKLVGLRFDPFTISQKLRPNLAFHKTMLWLLALVALMGTTGHSGAATLIYQQNFGATSTGQLTAVDWQALSSFEPANLVSATQPHQHYLGLYALSGAPSDAPNVNAGPSASDQTGLLRLYSADNRAYTTLAFTQQYTIDRSAWEVETISFYAAKTNVSLGTVRAAIRINSLWYVSGERMPAPLSSNADTAFATSARLIEINFSQEEWYLLTAEVGSSFSIASGSVEALPEGDIDAFGVFADPLPPNDRRLMIDTYSITATAVPEPTSAALLLLVAGAMLFRSHSHSKR